MLNNFDLNTANWRQSQDQIQHFIEALTSKLDRSLPGCVIIDYGFSFKKQKPIKKVTINMRDNCFTLDFDRLNGIKPQVGKKVRGITLSTRECSLKQWMQALQQTVAQEAQVSQTGLDLLDEFLLQ